MVIIVKGIKNSPYLNLISKIIEKWVFCIPIIYLALSIVYTKPSVEFASHLFRYFSHSNFIYKNMIYPQISTIITVSAVLIGFYVTSMSVFGTSASYATNKIANGNKTDQFIKYSCVALGTAFVVLLYSVVLPVLPWIFAKTHLYIFCFLFMILAALRFAAVVILMYSININTIGGAMNQQVEVFQELVECIKNVKLQFNQEAMASKLNEIDQENKRQLENAPLLPHRKEI